MRRIRWCHPFRRGSPSSTDIKEIGSDFPDFRFFFKSGDACPLTLVKTSCKRVVGPILCAESDGAVRLSIYPLGVAPYSKTCPISHFLNQLPQTPSSTVRTSIKRVARPI